MESRKLADYLLSREHPIGKNKAQVFAACGYDERSVDDLTNELKRIIECGTLVEIVESSYGSKYIVEVGWRKEWYKNWIPL